MILRVTDSTGDTMVEAKLTNQDELAKMEKLFGVATKRNMWGKAIKDGEAEFLPTGTPFQDILEYDEVIMLPIQVGG